MYGFAMGCNGFEMGLKLVAMVQNRFEMGRNGLQWAAMVWVCNGLQWVAMGRNGFAMVRNGLRWVAIGLARDLGRWFYLLFWVSVGVLDLEVGEVFCPEGRLPHVGEDKVQRGSLPKPEGRGLLYARQRPAIGQGSAKPVVALRRNWSRGPMCPRALKGKIHN